MLLNWDRCFPSCEPLGHRLRVVFRDRWVRFHSLPESKRYPESEAEYTELLARHNRVLGELTPAGSPVIVVMTEYSGSPVPSRFNPNEPLFDPLAAWWRTVPSSDSTPDSPGYRHSFGSVREWRPGEFDPLIRLVAEDRAPDVLLVAPDCRWVLHPYDGGMDVIAESSTSRTVLRNKFSTWLSTRADGL
jgi:hypothetical protein